MRIIPFRIGGWLLDLLLMETNRSSVIRKALEDYYKGRVTKQND